MSFDRVLVTGGSGFIGTNLIENLRGSVNASAVSLDLVPPKLAIHKNNWQVADVRDVTGLVKALKVFQPDAVIHLAARTDLDGRSINEYTSNTDGTSRLLEALENVGFTGPAIFTSSMYVCRPGYRPISDTDYQPHTVYGESKAIGEQLVRSANPSYPWIITRPTSIWGPWFGIPYVDFFNMVLSKRYLHIGGDNTRKTYGYVGNTVAQIISILQNAETLRAQTLYLGDWPPYVIREWADEIAAFVPYRVSTVPKGIFKGLALVGDALQHIGARFPMTTFRLQNMTTDNVHDLGPLQTLMKSSLPFSRAQGNALTVKWLQNSS